MNTIEIQYAFDRSPDEVFRVLTDFNQHKQWRTQDEIRLEPPGQARVGTRLLTKVTRLGAFLHFTNEVVELDPARRVFRDRWLDGTFLLQSHWKVDPREGGARLTAITEFEGRGLVALLTPVLRRAIRRGQLGNLAKLKQQLEQR